MDKKSIEYIAEFIKNIKSQLNIDFESKFEYDSELDEFSIIHNSEELRDSEELDNDNTRIILKNFIEEFYDNGFYNICLDYQPSLFTRGYSWIRDEVDIHFEKLNRLNQFQTIKNYNAFSFNVDDNKENKNITIDVSNYDLHQVNMLVDVA